MKRPQSNPNPQTPPTDWGDVADWYDQLVGESGSEYHRHVVIPGTLKLLAVEPGQRVVDVACGQGVLCRVLAARGVEASGVDAARDLIDAARKRGSGFRVQGSGENQETSQNFEPRTLNPHYFVGDARHLDFLPASHFHGAACMLAIQNIHPIAPAFAGVARALVPGGRFVVVMMHPCFRGPKETSWGWDEKEKVQYRRVDRYLLPRKSPIVTNPGKSAQYTWTFHRPIEDYVKAARSAGMMIDAIEEWPSHKTSTSGPRAAAENTARKEIPMFMAMRAVKIGAIVDPEVAK